MKFIKTLCIIVMTTTTLQTTAEQFINEKAIQSTLEELYKIADNQQFRVLEKGVKQVAAFWLEEDGTAEDFKTLCLTYAAKNEMERQANFERIQSNFELLWGSFNKMSVELKLPMHVAEGDILPIDRLFSGYEASAHFSADMFSNKLAFIVMLNYPFYSLAEKTELGESWTRLEWAFARLGDVFKSRVPAQVLQVYAQLSSDIDAYISDYNIFAGQLINDEGHKPFSVNTGLISHWGLRDEIKAAYSRDIGFDQQALIYQAMVRIIRQEIPQQVINNPELPWNPFSNTILVDGNHQKAEREMDIRYQHLLDLFKSHQQIDAHSPLFPTYISRKFDDEMEIAVEDVEQIFIKLVSSPELKEIGALISKRLGRELQAWDIWYDGFKTRSRLDIAALDARLKKQYPNSKAFENDLPIILMKLGFNADSAASIASKITVDASRGAGHAWGAQMRSEKARLRSRIEPDGMDYKGYNIAMHEFGHNVEQTITLHDVDYYMLNGVPNTSFTEALAFIFQSRDLEILDMEKKDEMAAHIAAIDNLWSNYEIMGVSLVDIAVWRWLYANPNASVEALKAKVIEISIYVWNTYYAPVFGVEDSPILGIYSHMIAYPLYLSAYPVGQLIEFQFENHIRDKDFATEIYRAFTQGRITPQMWMKGAVGHEISPDPAIRAARKALGAIE
jgi:hypothetical protein